MTIPLLMNSVETFLKEFKGNLLLTGPNGSGKAQMLVSCLKKVNFSFKLISYGHLLLSEGLVYGSPRRKLLRIIQTAELDGTKVFLFTHLENFLEDAAIWLILKEYLLQAHFRVIATIAKESKWLSVLREFFDFSLEIEGGAAAAQEASNMIKFEGKTEQEAQNHLRGVEQELRRRDLLTLDSLFGVPEETKKFLLEAASFKKNVRGVLLSGPPGTGKTRLAAALAGSLGDSVKVFNLASSDLLRAEIGHSEEMLREAFGAARAASPSMIFLDEIEALFPQRDPGHLSTILEQFVAEFDALEREGGKVFVLAATNFPEKLNRRLLQAGRLEVRIEIGLPGPQERRAILTNLLKGEDYNLDEIVKKTSGFTPAKIVKIVKDSVLK